LDITIKQIRLLFFIVLITLVSACSEVPKRWDTQGYTVKPGDTLYAIAWRYEKDYRQIAEYNNIPSPYAIYPGQRLRMQPSDRDGTTTDKDRPQVLTEPSTGEAIVVESPENVPATPLEVIKSKPLHAKVHKNDTLYSIAQREGYSHHQLARWNHLRSPYVLKPGQKLRLSPPPSSLGNASIASAKPPVVAPLVANNIKVTPLVVTNNRQTLPVKVDRWHWPAKGRVIKTYKSNEPSRKGIGIRGKLGQSVKAAAAGTVVYSGNGLINYGNLIIIKHSHSFLSAYAYNQSLLVKEGDTVKRGQSIAKMGKLESKPQLHFEIRRNGKPVNPLNYLPKS